MSNILSFYCPTKIFMGINAHRKVDDLVKESNIKKVFLLVDPAVLKTKIYSLVEDLLKKNKVAFESFSEIEPDPSARTVEKAF
jgi:alcohol dehydrogenase